VEIHGPDKMRKMHKTERLGNYSNKGRSVGVNVAFEKMEEM